jgi:excisionase family DNA binding protein
MDEVFTVEEVATRLKLNADSVRRLLRNKQLPGIKVGAREWRVSSSALSKFIETGSVPAKVKK